MDNIDVLEKLQNIPNCINLNVVPSEGNKWEILNKARDQIQAIVTLLIIHIQISVTSLLWLQVLLPARHLGKGGWPATRLPVCRCA